MIRRILTRFIARLLVDAGRETRRIAKKREKSPRYYSRHAQLWREVGPRQRRHRRLML